MPPKRSPQDVVKHLEKTNPPPHVTPQKGKSGQDEAQTPKSKAAIAAAKKALFLEEQLQAAKIEAERSQREAEKELAEILKRQEEEKKKMEEEEKKRREEEEKKKREEEEKKKREEEAEKKKLEEFRKLQEELHALYKKHEQEVTLRHPEMRADIERLQQTVDKADDDLKKQIDRLMSSMRWFQTREAPDKPSSPTLCDLSVRLTRSPSIDTMVDQGTTTATVPGAQEPPKKRYDSTLFYIFTRSIPIELNNSCSTLNFFFVLFHRPRSLTGEEVEQVVDSDESEDDTRRRKTPSPAKTKKKPFKPRVRAPTPDEEDEEVEGDDDEEVEGDDDEECQGDDDEQVKGDVPSDQDMFSDEDDGDESGDEEEDEEIVDAGIKATLELIADTGRTWKKRTKKFSPFPGSAKVLTPSHYERKRMDLVSAVSIYSYSYFYDWFRLFLITYTLSRGRFWALMIPLRT